MNVNFSNFSLLADGMGEPGLDIPTPLIVFGFATIIGLITGISRRLGASRTKAVCIPCIPLGLLTICSIPIPLVGQGGAVPMVWITAPAFGIALAASFITAFIVESKMSMPPGSAPQPQPATGKFTNDKTLKTVRVYDFKTKKTATIPAAELAPGMMRVNMEGVGEVYVQQSELSLGEYRHPLFSSEIRDLIKDKIMIPMAEVNPMSLEQWEDGFRRDQNVQREIALWIFLAERFAKFSEAENLNQAQRKECFQVMLGYTNNREHVLETIKLSALTREQARRAIEAMSRREKP